MAKLKYSPWALVLNVCGQTLSGPHSLKFEHLKAILEQAKPIDPLQSVHFRATGCDPTACADLIQQARTAAWHGFSERVLWTNGEMIMRHDREDLLRAFTRIEIRGPGVRYASSDSPMGPVVDCRNLSENPNWQRWTSVIEACVWAKHSWQLPAVLTVHLPEEICGTQFEERLAHLSRTGGVQLSRKPAPTSMSQSHLSGECGMQLCEEPYRVVTFSEKGDLMSCSGPNERPIKFGSISEHTLAELWTSEAAEAWRGTRLSTTCGGCPGRGDTTRRAALISVYETLGEKQFHEQPKSQLEKIARSDEAKQVRRPVTPLFVRPAHLA